MNAIRIAIRGISDVKLLSKHLSNVHQLPTWVKTTSVNQKRFFNLSTAVNSKSKDDNEEALSKTQHETSTEKEEWAKKEISLSLKERFKIFYDEDSKIILDADELRHLEAMEPETEQEFSIYDEKIEDEFAGYNLTRGIHGVFDLEEMVEILKKERASDICVIKVPTELHYTDYLILITAMSQRHIRAMTEFLKKLHKRKRSDKDPFVDEGGKTSLDWKVIDFGNIIVHIFMKETRKYYDLETLWTVGRDYDDLSQHKPDEISELIQLHSYDVDDIRPLKMLSQSDADK